MRAKKPLNIISNAEWAKEIRARVADLNELMAEATARDAIIQLAALTSNYDNVLRVTVSERI